MTRTRSQVEAEESQQCYPKRSTISPPLKPQTAKRSKGRPGGGGTAERSPLLPKQKGLGVINRKGPGPKTKKMLHQFVQNLSQSIVKAKSNIKVEVIDVEDDEDKADCKNSTEMKPPLKKPQSVPTRNSLRLHKSEKHEAVSLPDLEDKEADSGTEDDAKTVKSSSSAATTLSGRISDVDSGFKSFEEDGDEKEMEDVAEESSTTQPSGETRSGAESPAPQGQYEIEDVVDYVNETSGVGEMYLIKWKNWDADFNTWEPPANVVDCEDALLRFYFIRKAEVEAQIAAQVYIELPNGKRRRKGPEIWKIPPDPRPLEVRLNAFYDATTPLNQTKLNRKYLQWNETRMANKGKDLRVGWSASKLNKYLTDGTEGKLGESQMKELRKELYYVEIERKQLALDEKLKDWAIEINAVTLGKPFITVENKVDFELPPKDFKYVSGYIPAEGIVIPSDPPLGCECTGSCYDNRKKCCGELSGTKFAYSRHKKVAVPVGTPIYECNKKCACGPDCVNRVVQDGTNSEAKLCIFRTSNGCGWGVKAMKPIKKGCFVCLYVGEVIYTEEVERRSRDGGKTTYVLDLDFNDQENPVYSVDASHYGNVSHFINHSCYPNLGVFAVWVDCLDPNLPKIALFAIKDIAKGEELSFDYTNELSYERIEPEEDASGSPTTTKNAGSVKKECLCGAFNCRKELYI